MTEISERENRDVSWRALVMGSFGVAIACFLAHYSAYVVHSSRVVFAHLPMAAMLVVVFLVLPMMWLLHRFVPRLELSRGDFIVIFCMIWIGATIPAANFAGLLVATIAAPYYFASFENRWAESFHPYLPQWALPSSSGDAMTWFFEGKPPGESIPWSVWIIPLFWWGLFLAALGLVGICVVAILRKQWVDKERLPFPLAEVPIVLSEQDRRLGIPALFRNRLFLIGMAVPFVIIAWNIGTYFYPQFPEIPIGQHRRMRLGRYIPSIDVKVNFFCIGFAYFTNLDVLLSIWLFYVINLVQMGIFNRTGFTIGSSDMWGSRGGASFGWQNFGAFTAMTLLALWVARKQLADVFRKAVGRAPEVDDSDELLSYRAAFWGLLFGTVFLIAWLVQSGMSLKVAIVFFLAMMIMYIGVTKFVAESGQIYMRAPITPQSFTFYTIGLTNMTPASATSLALSYAHFGLGNSFAICPLAHIARLGAVIGVNKKKLLLATVIALGVGMVTSVWVILYLGYRYGAYNFGVYTFRYGNQAMFNNLVSKMRNPFGVDWSRMAFFGVGAVTYVAVAVLRYRVAWWPVSPIGCAVSSIWVTHNLAFSIFITWVAKFTILSLGGINGYRRARPLFLGLLIGYVVGVGVSFLVDAVFFMGNGHMIHVW
ncbi:MAG: hypothetical protein GXP25_20110 [Planctomycetes bacterium]|nr:hypothetical protein [Planctomycetota bacterium]